MVEENIIQNFLEGYYGFECTLASPHTQLNLQRRVVLEEAMFLGAVINPTIAFG